MDYASKKKMQKLSGALALAFVISIGFAPSVRAQDNDNDWAVWWEKKKENGRKRLDKAADFCNKKVAEVQEWAKALKEKALSEDESSPELQESESQKYTDPQVKEKSSNTTRTIATEPVVKKKPSVQQKKDPVKITISVEHAVEMVSHSDSFDFNIDTLTILVDEDGTLPQNVVNADGEELPLFCHDCWFEVKELQIVGSKGSLTDLKPQDFFGLTNVERLYLVNHAHLRRMPQWVFSANFLPELKEVGVINCGFPYQGEQENKVRLFRKECLSHRDDVVVKYGKQAQTNYSWVEYFYTMCGSYSLRDWKRWLESEPSLSCPPAEHFKKEARQREDD